MVKHIDRWYLAKKLKGYSKVKVYVKPFSGAKTHCMIDYSKSSVRHDPNHFILHVGTDDFTSEKSPESIAYPSLIWQFLWKMRNEK